MDKIKTAEDFCLCDDNFDIIDTRKQELLIHKLMQEFAIYHVQQALEAAHFNFQAPLEDLDFTLSSYPLKNIK